MDLWFSAGGDVNGLSVPKHSEISNYIRTQVQVGKLAPGARVPSDDTLCRQFSCGRGTVRRAIQTLVSEGVLTGLRGTGTFVSEMQRDQEIALIVPNIITPEHAELAAAVAGMANARGLRLILFTIEQGRPFEEYVPYEYECIASLRGVNLAGVIKAPTNLEHAESFRAELEALGAPLVMVNDFYSERYRGQHVLMDEWRAAELAVEHLHQLGHRCFAYYASQSDPHMIVRRALKKLAAERDMSVVDPLMDNYVRSVDWLRDLFLSNRFGRPTALISRFHGYGVKMHSHLAQCGLRVPEDISMVNLGGLPARSNDIYAYTSVVAPTRRVAECAMDLLLSDMEDGHTCMHLFEPTLHVGESSCAPRSEVVAALE